MPARDVTLTLKLVRVYTLTIVVDPVEGGTAQEINGFTEFSAGNPTLLRTVINAGYGFTGWFEGATPVGGAPDFTYYMPARDVTLTLKLVKFYTLTIVADPSGGGTANEDSGSTQFTYNQYMRLIAIPNSGYKFTGWYDETDTLLGYELSMVYFMPGRDLVITAKFEPE